jgi:DnaJ-domain-containing protein 1
VRGAIEPDLRRVLGPGELVRVLYCLGRQAASGVLTLAPRGRSAAGQPCAVRPMPGGHPGRAGPRPGPASADRPEVVVLRRGAAICGAGDLARRALTTRLARAAAEPSIAAIFDAGVTACPPGALHQVALAAWARSHLEAQLDAPVAEALVHELAGARLTLRPGAAPVPTDEVDRRMLAAIAEPRRLDQIWLLARTPRFRLLAFLHFLRGVGALVVEPVATARTAVRPIDPRRAAMRVLGLEDASDPDAIKRAYRRLARAVHPDLQPGADAERRRALERRFAELTAAYEALV